MQRMFLLTMLSAVLLAAALVVEPAAAEERKRCFEETGHCISGAILEYWELNGGAEVFGYPISPVRTEVVPDEVQNWKGPVQWFQRDRLEDHTVERKGVLSGRLGVLILAHRGQAAASLLAPAAARPDCRYFADTEHNLCEPFLSYWESNGGLARFGFPITEQIQEQIGNWSGTVQYFERRRLEHHPDEPGTPVQMGLLGDELLELLCATDGAPAVPTPHPGAGPGVGSMAQGCPATPAPPATANITAPSRGEQGYSFELSFTSSQPETIHTVDVSVLFPDRTLAYSESPLYQPNQALSVLVPHSSLTQSGEYTVEIRARARDGAFIEAEDGEVLLATAQFGHTLAAAPAPPGIEIFDVAPIQRQGGSDTLEVTLRLSGDTAALEANREFIEGSLTIYENNTGIYTHTFELDLAKLQIKMPLEPGALRPGQEYELAVVIVAPNLAPITSERYGFEPKFPAPLSFWEQYIQPVVGNPLIVGGILLVVFLVALVLIYSSQPRKRAIPNPVYSARTYLSSKYSTVASAAPKKRAQRRDGAQAAAPAGPRLKVAVVRTVDGGLAGGGLVTRFPYVIGREGADLLIPGDTKVSRCHVELSARGDKVIIRDLNSANGTALVRRDAQGPSEAFAVTRRLEKGGSVEWDRRSLIRLGPNTVLKLEPLAAQ